MFVAVTPFASECGRLSAPSNPPSHGEATPLQGRRHYRHRRRRRRHHRLRLHHIVVLVVVVVVRIKMMETTMMTMTMMPGW
jgi:hypothetical protein